MDELYRDYSTDTDEKKAFSENSRCFAVFWHNYRFSKNRTSK